MSIDVIAELIFRGTKFPRFYLLGEDMKVYHTKCVFEIVHPFDTKITDHPVICSGDNVMNMLDYCMIKYKDGKIERGKYVVEVKNDR